MTTLTELENLAHDVPEIVLAQRTALQLIALVRLQNDVIKDYSTQIENNQCVDYHVCCGVADDLSHDSGCKAMNALAAYEQFGGE
jgi:hypothetical protein